MTQQDASIQTVANLETDDDGVLLNICQIDQTYYAKVRLRMTEGANNRNANILPYLIVKSTPETQDTWVVRATGRTDTSGTPILVAADGPGHYRVYIKEPTETFTTNEEFEVPQHALADGNGSGHEVQPLFELTVNEAPDCTLSVSKTHPNGLGRGRGNAHDQIVANGARHNFTQAHARGTVEHALDLGDHVISRQLWADASRTYGALHPHIQQSDFRAALTTIYSEQLTPGTGAGAAAHDRTLTFNGITIDFNNQSTTGGRARLSFRNGQPQERMTPDESLRKTHPIAMEYLLQVLTDMEATYARITGAWRPHTGSTRHRYASAIDITHLRTTVTERQEQGQRHDVEIWFHNQNSPSSNPSRTAATENADRRRKREFSHRFHAYIASSRIADQLGWLGGPWALTYAHLGLQRAGQAIATDAVHVHHVHLSVGTDQP